MTDDLRTDARQNSLHATVGFLQTSTAKWIIGVLTGAIVSAATALGGWALGKLDNIERTEKLQRTVDELQLAQAENFRKLLGEDQEHPGRLFKLEQDQRFAYAAILEARSLAIANETEKTRRLKKLAVLEIVAAYNARVNKHANPPDAFDEVVTKIAVR